MRRTAFALIPLLFASTAYGATDSCLTGTWLGEIGQARDIYEAISPVPVTGLGGVVTLSIAGDGAAEGQIDGFHVDIEQGGMTLINSGEGTFALALSTSGATLNARFTAFDVKTRAVMQGPEGTPPQVLKEMSQGIAGMPVTEMAAEYTCDATTLTITSDEPQQMPIRVWTRQ